MIFMGMCDHQTEQIITTFLDKFGIREQNINPGKMLIRKANTTINGKPLTASAIHIQVDPKLFGSTKRNKDKLIRLEIIKIIVHAMTMRPMVFPVKLVNSA